mmetsp:Transcript_29557/g.41575  ORF Transcript_29557/g.41575 Transcript_29557/m.41575 type:complete len:525 (-) Transcript_29557:180-1754(-)
MVDGESLTPTPVELRTWDTIHITALWVGMAVNVPTYMAGAGLLSAGLNWWQAVIMVALGNVIVLAPMIMNGHAGVKYGIPFPVFIRSMFGIEGAKLASLLRGFIGCCWFGIQTWIGGDSIYECLRVFWKTIDSDSPSLGSFVGINLVQFICFMLFWIANMVILYKGTDSIKWMEVLSSPLLLLVAVAAFIWAWVAVGSLTEVLHAADEISQASSSSHNFVAIFWSTLTAMVGLWATLSINITDFTRFAKRQRDQALGTIYALPTTTVLYAFVGIFVTSASKIIYGESIWNPIELVAKFDNPFVTLISMFIFIIATLSTNVPANIVAGANTLANIRPDLITYKRGGVITGVCGILIFPWKILNSPNNFLEKWLVGSSTVLGSLAGVMICDYWVLRRKILNIGELYRTDKAGSYWYHKGYNWRAFVSLSVSLVIIFPGFLMIMGAFERSDNWFLQLYNYSWFVCFAVSFGTHYLLAKLTLPFDISYAQLDEEEMTQQAAQDEEYDSPVRVEVLPLEDIPQEEGRLD